jgi:acetylornithine deacetylase/succinyl-diaminopimelate desuccinylase-like protein
VHEIVAGFGHQLGVIDRVIQPHIGCFFAGCTDGFYDDVVELSSQDREDIAKVPFVKSSYIEDLGVEDTAGEEGFTTLERQGSRPSLDLNGIWGGFQGKGTKTIIPSMATAKITCRLVANQKPKQIFEQIRSHVFRSLPKGVTAKVISLQDEGEPFLIPKQHKSTEIAREILKDIYGKEPYVIRIGGSIPILSAFLNNLGVHGTMFAFGLDDENIHSPNEYFRLSSFYKGQEAYCKLFSKLGEHSYD